jgi:hypothetical protein
MLPCGAFLVLACASAGAPKTATVVPTSAPTCDLTAAGPWIAKWLDAWAFTSREILHLPDAPPPLIVFYDARCVYTTSEVTAPGAAIGDGPRLRGERLPWRTAPHDGTLMLPNGKKTPVQLMSFTSGSPETGPFFVMAAPSFWEQAGHGGEPGLTGVFLHEFSHTRQLPGVAPILGPIDAAWKFKEELDDDVVQTRFQSDPAYVQAYTDERDLLYRAASADSITQTRALAAQARWFTGENAVFATLDDLWLSMEGAGQWTAAAWLAHPAGGGLSLDAAVVKMKGSGRHWTQDEGLGLFLVVDRLLPQWPSLVYAKPSLGAADLLARAVEGK